MLSGSIPLVMVLSGGVQGAYDTFIASYRDNGTIWLVVLACFPAGFIWTWKDYKKGKL
jgi:hypothetical protein